MARKSHFSKGISTLLLIGLVSVTLLPTNAFVGWSTVKSRNFNNAYEGNTGSRTLGEFVYIDDVSQTNVGILYAYAEAYYFKGTKGEASKNYVFDSSIQGSASRVPGKSYRSYRAYATFSLGASMSGDNKYVKVTVKLIYFSGAQKVAAQKEVKYTKTIQDSVSIYTPSYNVGSIPKDFYVEVTVRVYTRAAWGQAPAKVNMANSHQFHLKYWGIQQLTSIGE